MTNVNEAKLPPPSPSGIITSTGGSLTPISSSCSSAPSLTVSSGTTGAVGGLGVVGGGGVVVDPRTLAKLFPSTDPLDNPDFDIVDWVNKTFPDEQSLSNIDTEIESMKKKIAKIDEEIISSVSQQSRAGGKGEDELKKSKDSIKMLFSKIKEIREKAIESEKMVQEICKDIRDLDCAKQNLIITITALTRLHNIVTQNGQLREMTKSRRYKEVQNLLGSITNLFEYFEDYKNVPKMIQLQNETNEIKKILKEQIFAEFGELEAVKLSKQTGQVQNLSHACFVVNMIGKEHREDFIKQFCERQLSVYGKEYFPSAEKSKLSKVDSRYSWGMELLTHFRQNYSAIYPPLWHVPEHLMLDFCKRTREAIANLFAEDEAKKKDRKTISPNSNPSSPTGSGLIEYAVYHRALEDTYAFEMALCTELPQADNINKDDEEGDDNFVVPELSADSPAPTSSPRSTIFEGKIGGVFEENISIFTNHHERDMKNFFEEAFKDESAWKDNAPQGTKRKNSILQSSCDLVHLVSNKLRSMKKLPKGLHYLLLFGIFTNALKTYAGKLKERLETLEGKGSKVLNEDQLKQTCVILNTANYCSKTTKEIEVAFKTEIADKYKDRIVTQQIIDSFESLITMSLKTLVRSLSISLTNDGAGPNFRSMITINWITIEAAGDQSDYINTINTELTSYITLFRSLVVEEHFTFLCDSVARAIIQVFESQIWLIRGVSEVGAEQLLVDATSLKGVLTKLPIIGAQEADAKVTERFIKRIDKEMTPIEKLLKILMTPKEMLTETYKHMFHQAPSVHQFIKILNLKGISRTEQNVFLDQYGVKPNDPIRQIIHQPVDDQPRKNFDIDTIFKDFMSTISKKS